MCTNGKVFGPKRKNSAWRINVKITSCMSIKNALFTGLEGSQEWDCLLMRIALVCKGMYAVPLKSNAFLFLFPLSLCFFFLTLLIWCAFAQIDPWGYRSTLYKISLINVEPGNTFYSKYLVNLSTYNVCKSCSSRIWMWSSKYLITPWKWTGLKKPVQDLLTWCWATQIASQNSCLYTWNLTFQSFMY